MAWIDDDLNIDGCGEWEDGEVCGNTLRNKRYLCKKCLEIANQKKEKIKKIKILVEETRD